MSKRASKRVNFISEHRWEVPDLSSEEQESNLAEGLDALGHWVVSVTVERSSKAGSIRLSSVPLSQWFESGGGKVSRFWELLCDEQRELMCEIGGRVTEEPTFLVQWIPRQDGGSFPIFWLRPEVEGQESLATS